MITVLGILSVAFTVLFAVTVTVLLLFAMAAFFTVAAVVFHAVALIMIHTVIRAVTMAAHYVHHRHHQVSLRAIGIFKGHRYLRVDLQCLLQPDQHDVQTAGLQ